MKKSQALLASTLVLAFGGTGIATAQVTTAPVETAPVVTAPVVTGLVEAEDDDMVIVPFGVTVDQLEDMDVHDATGEEIGEVEEVLVDASGAPTALVIEFDTGFLGIGDRDVVVPMDQIAMEQDRLITSLTQESVEALPDWD